MLLTVAVKVTDCPKVDGFNELVTVVELAPLLTVCDRSAEVDAVKFVSPA